MTTSLRSALRRDAADGAGMPVLPHVRRRDQFEAVGLLVGILGVLLVVAATLGATQV